MNWLDLPQTRRFLVLGALYASALAGFSLPAVADDAPAGAEPAVVQLVIDYGDGVEKAFTRLPWKDGMTVLDALHAAKKHARGIQFEFRGSGATAFVTQIDDLTNEGRGRNWTYRVNDKPGTTSSGVHRLAAGDRILWKFSESR